MAFIERLVIGFVRGMGGPDIDKWLDDMPAQAGRAIGEILKKHKSSNGNLTKEGAEELNVLLKEQPQIASQAVSRMLLDHDGNSMLPLYVEVMNLVVGALRSNTRPLVLKGFIHNDDLLSYWSFYGSSEELNDFELIYSNATSIRVNGGNPSIKLLNPRHCDLSSYDLNSEIRRSNDGRLPALYLEESTKIESIEEFQLNLSEEKSIGSIDQLIFNKTVKSSVGISVGAPALTTMIESLSTALDAHEAPKEALLRTMKAINALHSKK